MISYINSLIQLLTIVMLISFYRQGSSIVIAICIPGILILTLYNIYQEYKIKQRLQNAEYAICKLITKVCDMKESDSNENN